MLPLGILVIILNFFDAVLTTAGLAQGVVTEVNPLLNFFFSLNPLLTFAGKVALVPLGVMVVVWKGQGRTWVYWGLLFCALIYTWAAGLHLVWLANLF
ncbi:MAG: hypothetical protein H0Z38_05325 [Firmicutes bacterium]|nr:hypothetical protein [Bacillota bacterium]